MLDTTEIVVGILADALDCPVSTEIPPQRPDRAVTVMLESDAGTDIFFLRPTYSITCWGLSDIDAKRIAMAAFYALTDAALTHKWLSSVRMDNLTRDLWTGTGQARYVLTFETLFNTDE